jgi:phosphoenolpyruvate carboxykinase (GTP)
VPRPTDLVLDGLSDTDRANTEAALVVVPEEWKRVVPTLHEHFDSFGDKLPQTLRDELAALEERLG